jgi:FtsH-binding integral membrane protein
MHKRKGKNGHQQKKRRAAMKNTMRVLGWMLVWSASAAYATQGGESESVGWLGYLFAGFFAVVIVTQLVPAAILFVGMVKGVFSAREKSNAASARID